MKGHLYAGYLVCECSIIEYGGSGLLFSVDYDDEYVTFTIGGDVFQSIEIRNGKWHCKTVGSGERVEISDDDCDFPAFIYDENRKLLGVGLVELESLSVASSGRGQQSDSALKARIESLIRKEVSAYAMSTLEPTRVLANYIEREPFCLCGIVSRAARAIEMSEHYGWNG